jgi:hypothetical protein
MLLHDSGFKTEFPQIRNRAASCRESHSEPMVNGGVRVLVQGVLGGASRRNLNNTVRTKSKFKMATTPWNGMHGKSIRPLCSDGWNEGSRREFWSWIGSAGALETENAQVGISDCADGLCDNATFRHLLA